MLFLRVFLKVWLNKIFNLFGKYKNFLFKVLLRFEEWFLVKKLIEKKYKLWLRRYKFIGELFNLCILLIINCEICCNLLRNKGVVFLGCILVFVCFFFIVWRYVLIEWWEVGLFVLRLLFYMLFIFVLMNIVLSLLMREFIVFVVRW